MEWLEYVLASRFGWTLEYARSLPGPDLRRLFTIMQTEQKFQESRRRR